jgi:hypothetical protein
VSAGLEDLLAYHCLAIGLPQPVRELVFARPRRWRFDLAWPDYLVATEAEGATWVQGRHTTGAGFAADVIKYNEAAIRGWLVLRFTSNQIESGLAAATVLRALKARGWKNGEE